MSAQRKEREGFKKVNETHEKLLTIFLEYGLDELAKVIETSTTEAHRKIKGETGFTLRQLVAVLDDRGVQIASSDEFVICKTHYESLIRIANKWTAAEVATLEGVERRKLHVIETEGGAEC